MNILKQVLTVVCASYLFYILFCIRKLPRDTAQVILRCRRMKKELRVVSAGDSRDGLVVAEVPEVVRVL